VAEGNTFSWPNDAGDDWDQWVARWSPLGSALISSPRAEHHEFALRLFLDVAPLTPEADLSGKLALMAWAFLHHWPAERLSTKSSVRHLRIPTN
jgi:hypothetical protein